MGRDSFSRAAYSRVRAQATQGGTKAATSAAEERVRAGDGLDPLVDPKGLPHLGPVRMSLPRFEREGDLWVLTSGLPMAVETVLDTTGSMGRNVDMAFDALPQDYDMLTSGDKPVLGRYDVQIATAIFNDVEDGRGIAVLARSQFEMAEKIAMQMAMLPPGRSGQGNGKEDPQFALFGGAYLTAPAINKWGLKYYHFTVSDEPVDENIDFRWLKAIFGDDVLDRAKENGHDFTEGNLPDTAQAVKDLQRNAHAFFLQVPGSYDSTVNRQWTRLYGADHVVVLPGSTEHLHYVKAAIIGLTEGVLDLNSTKDFLLENKLGEELATRIVRAVAHIPLGAQMQAENFDRIPKAGDLFREKTDLWPVDPSEVVPNSSDEEGGTNAEPAGPSWI